MNKLEILAVGRIKDSALRQLCDDYYRRSTGRFRLSESEFRTTSALERALDPRCFVVALDETGEQLSSTRFAARLDAWSRQDAFTRLAFVIGEADGLGQTLKQRANATLSLSPMTFGHRIARVVLAEQLYRAISILEGSPYHREG
ncbi:MAG: 23S rRNA (pseudouridine(1915)-N(3))-methyltransferase RlmH [Deltaproteobacteria bacterium]|nr:23S rRNA (pseudouridine(1915)-N(3))-methyltransferase RlmH [Deltaproteobacteria bacterium]